MIGRLARYTLRVYPPLVQVPFALAWAVGLTAIFAVLDDRVRHWTPDASVWIGAATLLVTMLLLRAQDDIRDADYDRAHNPRRPLPAGLVRTRDLAALTAAGGGLLLALNAGRGAALLVLLADAAYVAALLLVDRFLRWPPGDSLRLHLLTAAPVQPLLCLYLYAGFLRAHHLTPRWSGAVVIAGFMLAGLCLEFARKITRAPRPGERTYVRGLGLAGTSVVALAAAALSSAVVLLALRPWSPGSAAHGWGWLVVAPLVPLAVAAARFAVDRLPRWPAGLVVLYAVGNLAAYAAVGLLVKGRP